MKFFVTGGTGFVGTHFVRAALGAGHQVVMLRRPESKAPAPLEQGVTVVSAAMDVDLPHVFDGVDVLVHLAAHTPNPPYDTLDRCLYWNVYASVHLASQAFQQGVRRFVIAGSCFEYGDAAAETDAIDESTPLRPNLSYPTSKAAASLAFEGFAREHNVFLKVMRLYQIYGEGEADFRFWPSLRRAALAGEDFHMSAGEQVRDFVHVEEVARQLLDATGFEGETAGVPRVVPVATGHARSLADFARQWWEHWGATGTLRLGAVPYRRNELMKLVPKMPERNLFHPPQEAGK